MAEAADPRPFLAPFGSARLAREQPGNEVAGDIQVGLPPQLARYIVEGDHLDPATHVLQSPGHLREVAVTGRQEDAVDVARLEQHVDGHVEVAVGLPEAPAVLVDVPLDALDDHLVAEVAQRGLEAADVPLVVLVRLRPLGIERGVGVEPQRIRAVAAGELPQDVVAQTSPAVARDVLGVDVDSDSHGSSHFLRPPHPLPASEFQYTCSVACARCAAPRRAAARPERRRRGSQLRCDASARRPPAVAGGCRRRARVVDLPAGP